MGKARTRVVWRRGEGGGVWVDEMCVEVKMICVDVIELSEVGKKANEGKKLLIAKLCSRLVFD